MKINASMRETLAFLTKTVYHIPIEKAIVPTNKYFRENGEIFVQLAKKFGGFYGLSFHTGNTAPGRQRPGCFGRPCA
jgi:hypothetical protein